MSSIPYIEVMIMDQNYNLLTTEDGRIIANKEHFKSILIGGKTHSIMIKVKDLPRFQKSVFPYHLLDDLGTEFNSADIDKIFADEGINRE